MQVEKDEEMEEEAFLVGNSITNIPKLRKPWLVDTLRAFLNNMNCSYNTE